MSIVKIGKVFFYVRKCKEKRSGIKQLLCSRWVNIPKNGLDPPLTHLRPPPNLIRKMFIAMYVKKYVLFFFHNYRPCLFGLE